MIDERTLPPDLKLRYGVRPRNRWLIGVAVALGVVVLFAASWTAWILANPAVNSKLLVWDAVADDHTTVTWEVNRTGTEPVVCVVRVADANRHDVGYAVVTLPPGDDYVQTTYDVRTRAAGRVVELLGCAEGEAPIVAAPEFPPGTENPPQPWTP